MKRDCLLVALAVLLITSCTKKNEVSITNRNFDTEVEQQQNLVFTFNKDLVPDSVLNRWDTISFIKFTPEVKGKFRWNTNKELMFSPLAGFKPSTDYSCELQRQVLIYTPHLYSLTEKKAFNFHTPYLALNSASGYWSISKKNAGTAALMITLGFNYKVDPGTVAQLLHLSRNNEAGSFEVSSTSVNNAIIITMDGIAKETVGDI